MTFTHDDVAALREIAKFLRLAAHPGTAAAEDIADRLAATLPPKPIRLPIEEEPYV